MHIRRRPAEAGPKLYVNSSWGSAATRERAGRRIVEWKKTRFAVRTRVAGPRSLRMPRKLYIFAMNAS